MRAPRVNQMRFFSSSALANAEKLMLAASCSAADAMCFPQDPPNPLNGVPGQRPQPHFDFAGFSSFLAFAAGFSSCFVALASLGALASFGALPSCLGAL